MVYESSSNKQNIKWKIKGDIWQSLKKELILTKVWKLNLFELTTPRILSKYILYKLTEFSVSEWEIK